MNEFEDNEHFSQPDRVTFFLEFYHNEEEEESELNQIYQKLCMYGNRGLLEHCIIKIGDKHFSVSIF
jgi:hypothetical protein